VPVDVRQVTSVPAEAERNAFADSLPASLHDDEVADGRETVEATSLLSEPATSSTFFEAVEYVKGEVEKLWSDASGHNSLLEKEALLITSLHAEAESLQDLVPHLKAVPPKLDPLDDAANVSRCLARYATCVAQSIDAWAASKSAQPSTSAISLVLQRDDSPIGSAIGFVHWDDVSKSIGRQVTLDEQLGVVYCLPRDKQNFASRLAAKEMHIVCSMDVGMVPRS
jgi:hypothetical protein